MGDEIQRVDDTGPMRSVGRVREWREDEGWGVLSSDDTPGGCWVHFSMVLVTGCLALRVDQEVSFTFERAEQDGYDFRAIEVSPAGQEPARRNGLTEGRPRGAMSSTLRLSFDDE